MRPDGTITLLAMPASGESLLVRDLEGTVWLIRPPGAGRPERVDANFVDRAVDLHGWDRVDETFGDWDALDAARQARVAALGLPTDIDLGDFDEHDVREILDLVREWQQQGDAPSGLRALHRLLAEAPIVRRRDDLYHAVTVLLRDLDAAPRPDSLALLAPGPDRRRKNVHERMDLTAA